MYILVIVESPAKCKKIEKFLGSGYKCIASFGHIRELSNGIKSIDIENNYTPTFKNIAAKTKYIKQIREKMKGAKEVILATDDDREGEGIAWHICKVFKLSIKTTKRIIFHEITKPAIINAVKNYTYIDMNKVYAQQSRQILDLLVGYTLSPLLWKHISRNSKSSLSAGRCQTPALRLVYEKQIDINNSPGKKSYHTEGDFTDKNILFILNYNFETEDNMVEFLEDSVGHDHKYSVSKPKKIKKKPPLPFTTSRLQQKASNLLHYSPKQTMRIAQTLYEAGYITYMRTDSFKYSKEFIKGAERLIKNTYGKEYIHNDIYKLSTGKTNKKKDDNAQEAHEAIRPTKIDNKEIRIENKITNREKKLYELIWKNTMESCMSDAVFNSITAQLSAPQKKKYKCSEEQCIFLGWKIIETENISDDLYKYLLKIKNGITINYKEIRSKVVLRDLKTHYTEARLVQELEKRGIGRPSTFSNLISKIQERGYVKKENVTGKKMECIDFRLIENELEEFENKREFGNEKNKLVIQPIGILVIEFLLKYFDLMFNYNYTKIMEDDLDKIANGNKLWYKLCNDCYNQMTELIDKILIKKIEYKIDKYHTYIIGKYGPVIKYDKDDIQSFKAVKKDIDMEKLKRGEYKLEEILANNIKFSNNILGQYKNKDVVLKNGKYGAYLTYGDKNISLKDIEKEVKYEEITLKHVIKFINMKPTNKSILKELTNDISIRSGKYGPYVFYKTKEMKRPKFINLKGKKWTDVTIEWVLGNL
jgi:DNA topoisomerase I